MISVTEPIGDAFRRMKWILFQPFDVGKWFILGFSAFLAGLGEGGGGANFNPGGGGGDFRPSEAVEFVQEHLLLFVIGAAVLLCIGLAIGALLTWLSSRGKFMFLHGVVNNTAAVTDPWHRYRGHGNSLFVFRFLLQIAMGIVSIAIIAAAVAIAWPDITSDRFGHSAVIAILVAVGFFLTFGIAYGVLKSVIKDFVVPVMYVRNIRALPAFGVFRRELLSGHIRSFILFYLLKFMMAFGVGIAIVAITCMTCCIAGLPYISSVFFLPVLVFFRCYSLSFLEQFGHPWRIFPLEDEYSEEPNGVNWA